MTRIKYPLLLTTAALLAVQAFAQESQPDLSQISIERLMDIPVKSAAKKEQKLSETAAAVYVITADDIRRSGATSVAEALRLAPGLNVARIDSNRWAISIRGFNSLYSNKLLVLVDGRSVYTPSFSGVYWDDQDIPLSEIERIEIVRGPGSTLWGENAVNGVINILTFRADKTPGGLISAYSGNMDRAGTSFRYGGKLGSDAYYRLYGKYSNLANFKDSQGWDSGTLWQSGRTGFRVDWKPGARDDWTFQGEIDKSSGGAASQGLTSIAPITYSNDSYSLSQGGFGLTQWAHNSGRAETMVKAYFDRRIRDSAFLGFRVNTLDVEAQTRIHIGSRNDIVFGGEFRYIGEAVRNSFAIGIFPDRHSTDLFSGFLQDDIMLIPQKLRLTIGTKIEHYMDPGESGDAGEVQTQLSPNVRLLFTPDKRQSVWAAAATAARNPSYAETSFRINAAAFPGPNAMTSVIATLGNPDLAPESLRSYEFGYRTEVRKRLSVDLATFYARYGKLRGVESVPPQLEQGAIPYIAIPVRLANTFRGETYGTELAGNFDVSSRWRLEAGYSFLRVQLHALPNNAGPPSEESTAPEHQWFIRSKLDLQRGFEIDNSIYYYGPLTALSTPSYVRADVRIGWRVTESLDLSVAGQNLLQPRHFEFGNEGDGVTPNPVGRSTYGKLTWHF